MQHGGMIELRAATPADLGLLRRWDEQPHVITSDPNDDCYWGEVDLRVAAVLVDPLAANTRAHRFYERLGFRPLLQRADYVILG